MGNHQLKTFVVPACAAASLLLAFDMPVWSADRTWTCNYQAAAGLKWNGSRWNPASFMAGKPFALTVEGGTLTPGSAALPLSSNSNFVQCPPQKSALLSCFDPSGGWLAFDPQTGHGGVSKIYTAIKHPPNPGSTLSVAPFSCTAQ